MRHTLLGIEKKAARMVRMGGTYNAEAYAEAALDEFFISWPPGKEPTTHDLLALAEIFFQGIDVEIRPRDPALGGRSGFDVFLNSLPMLRHADCGCPPGPPQRQMVMVSQNSIVGPNDERGFSTCSDGRQTAYALANGLCVFVREMVCPGVLPIEYAPNLRDVVDRWRQEHPWKQSDLKT